MVGWIHVLTGPMFSGKTEALLQLIRRYEIRAMNPKVFRPSIDTRTNTLVSRAGTSFPATSVDVPSQIIDQTKDTDIIAIDEAQFFDFGLVTVVNYLAGIGKYVIVAGLDRNFLGQSFGPMGDILTIADSVDKRTAICFTCRGEATLTQRLIDGKPATYYDPLILVGGMGTDERYEARCRAHHQIGMQ